MFCELVRIGRDAELKTTQSGKIVMSLNVAYDVGYGQNKQTQWLQLSMRGQQAEKLCEYLTKGKQIYIEADGVRVEEHNGKAYLKAELKSVKFAGGGGQQQSEPKAGNQQRAHNNTVDDFDLPF